MTHDKETAREILRAAVLKALDEAANTIFGEPKAPLGVGATDADLPRLFRALDEQLDVLSERFNHPLYVGYIGSEKYRADRAELIRLGLTPVDDLALRR
jgi:hypothetical protein